MDNNTAQSIINKTRVDYNAIADQFSNTRNREWHEFEIITHYLEDDFKLLDLGCGNGRLLHYLKDKKIDYVGVDISENLIKIAKELAVEKNLSSHQFSRNDFTNLEFANQTFDLVVAIASIYHIPSKEMRSRVFSEIFRVLKKEGLLIMTYWNMWQYSMINLVAKNIVLKLIKKSKYDFLDAERPWKNSKGEILVNRYCHALTLNELKKICKEKNFDVMSAYYTKKGKRVHFWNGYNGVLIAKKR